MAIFCKTLHSRFGVHVCRLVVVATVLGSLCFIIYKCMTPKHPVFSIASVQIPPLHRRNFTANHHLSIILNFEIWNPNQGFRIHYDDIFVTMYHNSSVVGSKFMPGFQQNYHNNTRNGVLLYPRRQFWNDLRRSRSMDVRVHLRIGMKFQYKIFKTKTKFHRMELEALLQFFADEINLRNKIEFQKKDNYRDGSKEQTGIQN